MEKSKGAYVFYTHMYSDIIYHSHISRTTEYIQIGAKQHKIVVIIVIN